MQPPGGPLHEDLRRVPPSVLEVRGGKGCANLWGERQLRRASCVRSGRAAAQTPRALARWHQPAHNGDASPTQQEYVLQRLRAFAPTLAAELLPSGANQSDIEDALARALSRGGAGTSGGGGHASSGGGSHISGGGPLLATAGQGDSQGFGVSTAAQLQLAFDHDCRRARDARHAWRMAWHPQRGGACDAVHRHARSHGASGTACCSCCSHEAPAQAWATLSSHALPHTSTNALPQPPHRFTACRDRSCDLCKHNPNKVCTQAGSFDEAYADKQVRAASHVHVFWARLVCAPPHAGRMAPHAAAACV